MRVRPLALLSITAVSLLALAGCSTPSSPTATASTDANTAVDLCGAAVDSGSASEAVSVTGEFGQEPTVTFEAPLEVGSDQQSTVVLTGSGEKVGDGDYVSYAYVAYDASTGEQLGSAGYDVAVGPQKITGGSAVIAPAIGCATVGTRVVTTYPGSSTSAPVVFVIDVLSAVAADQWCQVTAPAEGAPFPTVAWDDAGAPVVSIPGTEAAPTAVTAQVLTEGTGETVQAGDQVTVDYQLATWTDGSVLQTTWGSTPLTIGTDEVVPGFGNALIGQQVGTTVLVVIPAECGYGTDTANDTSGLAGQTLVFVMSVEATARS